MKILIALPGLHKYNRGAEVAFISIARELSQLGEEVTLVGSGEPRAGEPYRFLRCPSLSRENFEYFPRFPLFRNEYSYEDCTFAVGLRRCCRPAEYDITVTCNYPFTNWALRMSAGRNTRTRHVFVTENGDWPAQSSSAEYRFFSCDGLVCTNPDFFDRNKDRWKSRLIPNGIDLERFRPGRPEPARFGIPDSAFVVLMVSALIPSKRVVEGIEAVARVPGAHLVVAGDGPLRSEVDRLGRELLDKRFLRLTVPSDEIPALYRSADVFLHLSKEESFGNVFLEALASGVPIVAHDTPRIRWIVGNDECLVDTAKLTSVSTAIWAARNANSPQRIAKRHSVAGGFSWRRIAKQYCLFFSELVHLLGDDNALSESHIDEEMRRWTP